MAKEIVRLRLREKGGFPKGEVKRQPVGRDGRDARSIREWAYRSGQMPHVLLLRVSRGEIIDGHKPTFEERVDAAKACQRYFAPAMKQVEVKDDTQHPPVTLLDPNILAQMSEDELLVLKRAVTRLAVGPESDKQGFSSKEAEDTYKSTIYH